MDGWKSIVLFAYTTSNTFYVFWEVIGNRMQWCIGPLITPHIPSPQLLLLRTRSGGKEDDLSKRCGNGAEKRRRVWEGIGLLYNKEVGRRLVGSVGGNFWLAVFTLEDLS